VNDTHPQTCCFSPLIADVKLHKCHKKYVILFTFFPPPDVSPSDHYQKIMYRFFQFRNGEFAFLLLQGIDIFFPFFFFPETSSPGSLRRVKVSSIKLVNSHQSEGCAFPISHTRVNFIFLLKKTAINRPGLPWNKLPSFQVRLILHGAALPFCQFGAFPFSKLPALISIPLIFAENSLFFSQHTLPVLPFALCTVR